MGSVLRLDVRAPYVMGISVNGTRVEIEFELLPEDDDDGPAWSQSALWLVCPTCTASRLKLEDIVLCPSCRREYPSLAEPFFWLPRVAKWFPAVDLPKPENLSARKATLWDQLQEEQDRLKRLIGEIERLQMQVQGWKTGSGNPIPSVEDLEGWLRRALALGSNPIVGELLIPIVMDEIHTCQRVPRRGKRTLPLHVLRRRVAIHNGKIDSSLEEALDG